MGYIPYWEQLLKEGVNWSDSSICKHVVNMARNFLNMQGTYISHDFTAHGTACLFPRLFQTCLFPRLFQTLLMLALDMMDDNNNSLMVHYAKQPHYPT